MKKLLFLAIMSVVAATASAQQKYVTEVQSEANERWWGMDRWGGSWNLYMNADADLELQFDTYMMVSSAGRYLWSEKPFDVDFDGDQMTVSSDSEKIEVQKGGKTLREAYLVCVHKNLPEGREVPSIDLFTHPVYKPGYRPDVTWGQGEIVEYARRIVAEGLPAGTIAIPEGWCSLNVPFAFSPELFPDPQGMVAELHKMGFKVMLTVTPRIPAFGRVFTDAYRRGDIMPVDGTFGTLDVGKHSVYETFRQGIGALKSQYAFDGFRLDGNAIPVSGANDPALQNWAGLAGGIGMCELTGAYKHAFMPYVTETDMPDPAAYPGFMLKSLLAASLSGNIYKTAAYGGRYPQLEGVKLAEYMAAALFFPSASVEFAPWEFGERNLYDHVKEALMFRASLADYMENLINESVRTGEPIARHMEYQFPRQGFSDCDDQFMLGPKYLIAPCLDGAASRMVRLPKGRWADKHGKKYKGPLVTEAACNGGVIYFELTK